MPESLSPSALMIDASTAPTESLLARIEADVAPAKIAAWGGYLGGWRSPAMALTRTSVDFLHSGGIAVLPIYNNAWRHLVVGGGVAAAQEAMGAMADLGAPAGTAFALDFEAEWLTERGVNLAHWWRDFRLSVPSQRYAVWTYSTVEGFDRLGVTGDVWVAAWNAPAAPNVGLVRRLVAWQYKGAAFNDTADLDRIRQSELRNGSGLWMPPPANPVPAPAADPRLALTWLQRAEHAVSQARVALGG